MTFDPRTEKNLKTLDPKAERRFRLWMEDAINYVKEYLPGVDLKIISGNRTWEQQDALYAQGRSKPGPIVTNAKGGQSMHNFGIAIDLGAFKGDKYLDDTNPKTASKIYTALAQDIAEYKMEWGGNWTSIQDEPHFQLYTGLTLAELRAKYKRYGSVL